MQLTRHTDYALRVLMYLATNTDRLSSVAEISDYYTISRNHLVKVVQGLTEHGFVLTTRGKHGGMKLSRAAKDVSIGEVVRKLENHFNMVECFAEKTNACCIVSSCGLKGVIHKATDNFLNELDKSSLADVL